MMSTTNMNQLHVNAAYMWMVFYASLKSQQPRKTEHGMQGANPAPIHPLENLLTAFTPSETACLASSPGNSRRTAVCTSREVRVARLL